MLNFDDLYEDYAPDVYRFALWLAGNRPDAEDITSETFVRAWVRRRTIRTETLKAYLFAIARNLYRERLRKHQREVTLEDVHADPAPGPEAQTSDRMALQQIRAYLQTLPEDERAAFIMRVQHELPYAEIGRVLKISEGAARVRVHRVRKKLLNGYAGEED